MISYSGVFDSDQIIQDLFIISRRLLSLGRTDIRKLIYWKSEIRYYYLRRLATKMTLEASVSSYDVYPRIHEETSGNKFNLVEFVDESRFRELFFEGIFRRNYYYYLIDESDIISDQAVSDEGSSIIML